MKLCGHNICAEHFSSYAPSLSAVEMSECFGRSAPSVTWLRPAWVSPSLSVGPLPAPPSLPQRGAGPPPQSRRSAAVPAAERPSKRGRSFEENTTTSSQHSLVPTASVGGRSGVATTLRAFFLPEITFLLAHLGPHCSSVTTLSRPGKGLHDGKKNCSNIYFSSNFQSWPSSQNHFTYFGDDFIIWNIFFCQVWFKVREMHRSFNLYWRATVLQYTQSDEITFRRKNLCRSRWSFCWKIDHYGLKGKSIYIDSQFSQISLAWTVIVKMSFLDFNHQLNSPSWPNANWLK